ncbi:MAG TPA: helix-turn-helix domain-containing protein [Pseudonocardiaceae bacterium]|nr:helix-turn-helix domain-containing protein [Pseudonocardiaceae bacterium]
MLKNTYEDQDCSIARTLEVVGERWTILIIRDALLGVRRFDQFLASLGVARTVLTDRLRGLVEDGILERVRYQERPARYEYVLTDKGRELSPIVVALLQWGGRHVPGPHGPSRRAEHAGHGHPATLRLVCDECSRPLAPGEVAMVTNG